VLTPVQLWSLRLSRVFSVNHANLRVIASLCVPCA